MMDAHTAARNNGRATHDLVTRQWKWRTLDNDPVAATSRKVDEIFHDRNEPTLVREKLGKNPFCQLHYGKLCD
ncbi:hypothetical protein CEXT_49321 [Caerostris extrusa]|uniref:Uncharacterized protein n=1 Tax=Caerostris extrusa TaxID=172846 RepID=A0AAV4XNV5_CAEEX|nr:hypothetical protein CEXT_49321 [Caerostris extrusa]